ncbi:alpha/beta fold hydrolase [Streptomyces wuyuanensis]|uniref:alpha/beta fold hydrolase n=1 Tax=Streptomyces wuyuanensis TaxID=1196353 RepID=UPI0037B3BE5E
MKRKAVRGRREGAAAALFATEQVAAVGQLVNSLELLTMNRYRQYTELNDWHVLREQFAERPRSLRRLADLMADRRVVRGVLAGRAVSAAALVHPRTPAPCRAAAHLWLTATSAALAPRTRYGRDGSDQMSFVLEASCLVARLFPGSPRITDAALRHIASQTTMSYAVSGLTKAAGPLWRSGQALEQVLRMESYGDRQLHALVVRYPGLGVALSRTVMALECLFPLVYWRGGRLAGPAVAVMGAFHVANARFMGLTRFLWAFLGSYPAVLHAARRPTGRKRWRGAETSRLSRAFAVAAGAGWAAGLAAQVTRHRRVLRGTGEEEFHNCASGNRLAYRLTEPAGPEQRERPVVVFEPALLSTSQQWGWLRRELAPDFQVLTYDRSGYGRSTYRQEAPYALPGAVEDCADLIGAVAPGRRVLLVGHAQGGYLALRTAARLEEGTVAGLVLIEPTHPHQLRRSPFHDQAAAGTEQLVALALATMRLGGGVLLSPPTWADRIPEGDRGLARAQHADRKTWAAGTREWRALRSHLLDPPAELPPVTAPVRLVAFARSWNSEPDRRALFQEITDASPEGSTSVVRCSGHDDLIADRFSAAEIARVVRDLGGASRADHREGGQ